MPAIAKKLWGILLLIPGLLHAQTDSSELTKNPLLYALAWKQTAAEYQALYHQGFNGYTDLMVDGAPSPHQPDTTLRWLIDRPRS